MDKIEMKENKKRGYIIPDLLCSVLFQVALIF